MMFFRRESQSKRPTRARPRLEILEDRLTPATAGNDLLWRAYTPAQAFSLSSNPGAPKTIYLDFDGHNLPAGTGWNSGNAYNQGAWSIDGDRTTFNTQERDKIIELWRRVSEDFIPFDVNVTTADPGLAGLTYSGGTDTTWGMRAVIGGPTPSWAGSGVGGLAFLNSFRSSTDVVCWVWNGDGDPNAENSLSTTVSHEVGHTLGLAHDGRTTPSEVYYAGHGAGAMRWGPIMGAAFGNVIDTWSKGEYGNADNPQDDLAIITGGNNGVNYHADDYSNTLSGAKVLNGVLQATLTRTYGVIQRNTDADWFSFQANPGPINIKIDPLFTGPNLDIRADLYNSTGTLLLSSNPVASLDASLVMNVPAKGRYYIRIVGTGLAANAIAGHAGYTNYASLGSYRITGTVTPFTPGADSLRVMNPTRWTYNRVTRTYDGVMTITNITDAPFTASFVFVLRFPPGVTVAAGPGTQVGDTYRIAWTGTLKPGTPLAFRLSLRNPANIPLLTGFNNYLTDIQVS